MKNSLLLAETMKKSAQPRFAVGQKVSMWVWEGKSIRRNGEVQAVLETKYLAVLFDGYTVPLIVPRCAIQPEVCHE